MDNTDIRRRNEMVRLFGVGLGLFLVPGLYEAASRHFGVDPHRVAMELALFPLFILAWRLSLSKSRIAGAVLTVFSVIGYAAGTGFVVWVFAGRR